MTRKEYLKQLKSQISALPIDEQDEALEYYTNYFEDACDDEKVISELGTPEELAQTIKDKFAWVPAKPENEESYDDSNSKKRTSSTGRSCKFDKKDVRSLDLSLGAAEIVIISGENYAVETRGMEENDLRCNLSPYGTLSIDNTRKFPCLNFLKGEKQKYMHPRILITVPENSDLDMVKIHVGAGSLVTKSVNVKASKVFIDVGAGNLEFNSLFGGRVDIRCGMGNIEMKGSITGLSRIDCSMGNVKLDLRGNKSDYSYDAKVGLGEIKVNDEKRSGINELFCSNRQANHFSIKCGMGAVTINVSE